MSKPIPEQLTEALAKIEELTATNTDLSGKLEKANSDLVASNARADEAAGKLEKSEAKVSELTTENGKLQGSVTELKASVSTLESENKDLKAKEQDIQKRADALAVEKMAAVGQTDPMKANAGNGREDTTASGLSGVAAVEAMYRDKYEGKATAQ